MATNPTLLTMPIAENGQKNTIPATQATAGDGLLSQSTGFPPETSLPLGAGGVAPSREDFNGAFNFLSNIAFYAQKGWTFEYDENQDYYKGCIIIDPDDGKRYECVSDMTAGTVAPHSDTGNTYWKEFSLGGGVAVGFIMPYAGTGLQEGWLDCDGSAVSRTMYPDLFAAIGTTWGAGDGSTTFNLPRSEDLVLQGASATNPVGTYKSAGLPNIEGTAGLPFYDQGVANTGAFNMPSASARGFAGGGSSAGVQTATFDASRSSAIYGNSDTVQPPAACVRYMIKAFDGPTPSSAGIDLTQYAQDLARKANRQLSNLDTANLACHVVVDSYYDSTTGDWWREYDDGWIEQGGVYNPTANGAYTITLMKPYADVNYSVYSQAFGTGSYTDATHNAVVGHVCSVAQLQNKTVTSFGGGSYNKDSYNKQVNWFACGMGASA